MRQCFIEEREARKVALGKEDKHGKKKKPGAKGDEQGQSLTVERKQNKLQLVASGKDLWYNQLDAVSKPSSSKDIEVSRMKNNCLGS